MQLHQHYGQMDRFTAVVKKSSGFFKPYYSHTTLQQLPHLTCSPQNSDRSMAVPMKRRSDY